MGALMEDSIRSGRMGNRSGKAGILSGARTTLQRMAYKRRYIPSPKTTSLNKRQKLDLSQCHILNLLSIY